MREIKFRVWDGKRMLYEGDGELSFLALTFDGKVIDLDGATGSYSMKEFKLLQYTGLKDKNGKEIYEKDIVIKNGCNIGVVAYFEDLSWDGGGSNHPGYYCKEWFSWNQSGELDYGKSFDNVEVVGNVYENPQTNK